MKRGRCITCAHWNRIMDSYNNENISFGECHCRKLTYTGRDDGKHENDMLEYWDGDGYYAGFQTGEHFGCIHHKESDK